MEPRKGPIKVPVRDKRRQAPPADDTSYAAPADLDEVQEGGGGSAGRSSPSAPAPIDAKEEKKDYKDLYLRAVADLENERKRFKMRERERAERDVRALIESLLPALDNFERAISHGEGGEGVALVFKQLNAVLEAEGLVEVAAEGAEFDPNLHEAVESRPQEGLEVPTVLEVHRRGYILKGQLLRAALVVVGRPVETEESQE